MFPLPYDSNVFVRRIITDLELLARLIQCEAGGEGDNGMRAVASVIMNRVHAFEGEYSRYNTLQSVANAPQQFECISSPTQNIYMMSPDAIHYEIAAWAISGGRLGATADSLWFFNPFYKNCPTTFPNISGAYHIRIGDHCFYRPTASYTNT